MLRLKKVANDRLNNLKTLLIKKTEKIAEKYDIDFAEAEEIVINQLYDYIETGSVKLSFDELIEDNDVIFNKLNN